MITQSEAPSPEEIQVHKHQIDISDLSAATENSFNRRNKRTFNTRKRITKNKQYVKYLALFPLRKDPIPNQDKKNYGAQ